MVESLNGGGHEEGRWYIPDGLRDELVKILSDESQAITARKMSYKEFLDWADEDTLAEWVGGEIVMSSPASRSHQGIVDFLVGILRPYVELHDLGILISAPFQMKLEHGREPDLLFVAQEHLDRLQDTYLDGPADMVVEIISPESLGRDRGEKYVEYEQGGVQEYWLIDPVREWVDFYGLTDAGRYRPLFNGNAGVFHSQVISGFWLRSEWLWQPPPVLQVLRELQLINASSQ